MPAEISYDLVMEDDMAFVEGTYRLPAKDWKVFVFSRYDVPEPEVKPSMWGSGVAGLVVHFPRLGHLNRAAVERVLSAALGVEHWVEVRGPDSILLR